MWTPSHEQLARECEQAGLKAEVVAPTRVRVSLPGAHQRLSETVRCMPGRDEQLRWWWSWDEPICLATEITHAVAAIKHVVTPPVADRRPSMP